LFVSFAFAVEPLRLPPRPKKTSPLVRLTPRVVADGTGLDAVDVSLFQTQDFSWAFTFHTQVTDNIGVIKAGDQVPVLHCIALEKMQDTLKSNPDAQFRVWGRMTQFQGKNYVFPQIFVILHIEPNAPIQADNNNPQEQKGKIVTNEPNDAVFVPDNIADMLQPKRTVDLADIATSVPQLEENVLFSTRTGFIISDSGDNYVFKPDGLGRNLQMTSFHVLPNDVLWHAVKEINSVPHRVRFRVTGILTKFQGQYYMLIQSASRQFSNGNLAR
jgi:hypothetical protein